MTGVELFVLILMVIIVGGLSLDAIRTNSYLKGTVFRSTMADVPPQRRPEWDEQEPPPTIYG